MEVKVGKYTIMSDNCCCWIMEEFKGKKKTGEEKDSERKIAGYSPNFEALLNGFCTNRLRNMDAKTVEDLLKQIVKVEKETAKMAKEFRKIGKGQK